MSTLLEYTVRTPALVEFESVRELRHAVLDPAKIRPTELDISSKDLDPSTIHAAAFLGEVVVSTVRLDKIDDATYLVRKMATAERERGQGVGKKVLQFAENEAIARGAQTIVLDSRKDAIPFYESLGFVLTGEEVMHNDGIPNFSMIKEVTHGK